MHFRIFASWSIAVLMLFTVVGVASAQPDQGGRRGGIGQQGQGQRGQGQRGLGQRGQGQRGGQGGPNQGGAAGPQMLMQLFDTDRDGEISAAEIENAAARLKRLDTNGDGAINMEDFAGRGGPGAGGRPEGGRPEGGRPEGGRPEGGRPEGGRPQGRNVDPAAMLERLFQGDTNGDGKLSGDEIPPQLARMIEQADTDGDGALSKTEVQTAMQNRGQRGGPQGGQGRNRQGGDANQGGGVRPRRPDRDGGDGNDAA